MCAPDDPDHVTDAPAPVSEPARRSGGRFVPTTKLGRISGVLIAVAAVFMYVPYWIALATGRAQSSNATKGWQENILGPMALVVVSTFGLTATVLAAIAIFRRGERSIVSFVALSFGGFILLFLVGELVGPH